MGSFNHISGVDICESQQVFKENYPPPSGQTKDLRLSRFSMSSDFATRICIVRCSSAMEVTWVAVRSLVADILDSVSAILPLILPRSFRMGLQSSAR